MLRELSVQNLALIADARVELQPGFCAWTGETGAGKTLLLTALGLLLGERGSNDLVRAEADEVRITGRFELDRPQLRRDIERLLGTPLEDEQIILTRRLHRAGRSAAYVNEQPVAVGTLRQWASCWSIFMGSAKTSRSWSRRINCGCSMPMAAWKVCASAISTWPSRCAICAVGTPL